ncbi:MAG TPA: S1 family peptidase [Pilimelia sp.]|nr:S1 family peptidase [Pilimelia sp.]
MPAGASGSAYRSAVETDGESLAFARERGISVAEAQQRLRWQDRAPELAERVEAALGSRFGGVWIDVSDGDRVRVGVAGGVTGDAVAAVRDTAAAVGLTDGYDVVTVRYSMAALQEASAWLGDRIARINAGSAATLTAGLRTDINAIELQVPADGTLTEAQWDLLAAAKSALGDRLVVGSYRGRPTARACAYPYCDPPLRGGIRINHPDASCTGAFIAKSKVDDKLYQFTAGHCAYQNYTDWSTRFTDNSVHVVGPVWTWWWYSGGDFAILRINNVPGWNPKAWVNVTAGPDTTADSTYHISSDNYSVLGMRICTTGAFYGRSDCGYVTQLDVTATYGGVTVHHLGRASFCGTGGDSGSPMYAQHKAYGLQVAGYSECDSLYQGIKAAETKLNVNVLHASS